MGHVVHRDDHRESRNQTARAGRAAGARLFIHATAGPRGGLAWYARPWVLAVVVLRLTVMLNRSYWGLSYTVRPVPGSTSESYGQLKEFLWEGHCSARTLAAARHWETLVKAYGEGIPRTALTSKPSVPRMNHASSRSSVQSLKMTNDIPLDHPNRRSHAGGAVSERTTDSRWSTWIVDGRLPFLPPFSFQSVTTEVLSSNLQGHSTVKWRQPCGVASEGSSSLSARGPRSMLRTDPDGFSILSQRSPTRSLTALRSFASFIDDLPFVIVPEAEEDCSYILEFCSTLSQDPRFRQAPSPSS